MTDWQSMDTAPTDGTEILFVRKGKICIGHYTTDKYLKRPVSFWDGSDYVFGKRFMQETQPTHWMPLPPLPNTEG
jgi:hypothetical protein